MEHNVYILYSSKLNKYYIGYSQDVSKRLAFHNSPLNKIWSKRGQPWELKVVLGFADKTSALKAERYIKRKKSTSYIQQVISSKQLF